jgi:hypothetical protein
LAQDVIALKLDGTGGGLNNPGDGFDRGRLTDPIMPNQRYKLTLINMQV